MRLLFVLSYVALLPARIGLAQPLCGDDEINLSVLVCCGSFDNKDKFPGGGKSDPYCTVSAGGHDKSTSRKNNDDTPEWNQVLDLGCVAYEDAVITVKCFDHDTTSSEDKLLDQHLRDWFPDGDNVEATLESHGSWVKLTPIWSTTRWPSSAPTPVPTPFPSVSLVPSSVPSGSPSSVPTSAPSRTFEPSATPTTHFELASLEAVQQSDSRIYDRKADSCYDSPRRGQRIVSQRVRVVAHSPGFIYLADYTEGAGPSRWNNIRAEMVTSPAIVGCEGRAHGFVEEVGGETRLLRARITEVICSSLPPLIPMPVTTGTVGGECSLTAEAYEGALVSVGGTVTSANSTYFTLDDGSGEVEVSFFESSRRRLASESPVTVGDSLSDLQGVVAYEDQRYFLVQAAAALSLDNHTSPPSLSPTSQPSAPPTTQPSATPLEPTASPSPAPSSSPSSSPSMAPSSSPASPASSDTVAPRRHASPMGFILFVLIALAVFSVCWLQRAKLCGVSPQQSFDGERGYHRRSDIVDASNYSSYDDGRGEFSRASNYDSNDNFEEASAVELVGVSSQNPLRNARYS